MKKYIGAICAGFASIFTFIFLALPAWKMEIEGLGKESFSGYKLISGKLEGEAIFEGINAWSAYRIFAIILIVLAVVLALYAIFMVLVNMNVIKVQGAWINLVNKVLIALLFVVGIVALISCMRINDGLAAQMHITVKQLKEGYDYIGTTVGLWLVVAFNAIACAGAWLLPKFIKK